MRVSCCVKGEQPKGIIILHYHVICKRWSVAFGSSIRRFRFSPSYMYLSSVKYFLYDDTSHGYANWRCHVYIILERASVGGRKVYWSAGFRSAFLFDGQFVVVQQTFGGVKGKLMYAQITTAIPFIVYKSNIVFSVLGWSVYWNPTHTSNRKWLILITLLEINHVWIIMAEPIPISRLQILGMKQYLVILLYVAEFYWIAIVFIWLNYTCSVAQSLKKVVSVPVPEPYCETNEWLSCLDLD